MLESQPEDLHDFQDTPPENDPVPESVPPPKGWDKTIKYLKEQLIDTSKRNRLINSPIGRDRGKYLDIVEERSDEVFRLLVHRRKRMLFSHSAGTYSEPENTETFFVPDPDPPDARHTDLKLQTRLTKDALHKRLLELYRYSNSSIEEQGFNPLFLVLGFVRWYESSSSELERHAPLVLLPVELVRESVKSNFRLVLRDEDLEPNHSFDALIKSDFDLNLPPWPETDEWVPSDYFAQVNEMVSTRERWEVCPNIMQLGFYSSGRFLMSRDLDKAEPTDLLEQLFEGFDDVSLPDSEELDYRYADPRDLGHIMEADASQTWVIAAARDGRNMVVQGPPGTGKSQTIANIIAVSVRDNQKVLFVAEKQAALDVVYERLKSCGLAPLCLNMHSTKGQKKTVYADLGETLKLGRPLAGNPSEYEHLRSVRDQLNEFSDQLHAVDEVTGETFYLTIGLLTKLIADEDLPRPDYHVEKAAAWNREQADEAREEIERLADLTKEFGPEGSHIWRGANQYLDPMKRGRLQNRLGHLQDALEDLHSCLREVCGALSMNAEGGLAFADKVLQLTRAMDARPSDADRLVHISGVGKHSRKLRTLLEDIQEQQRVRSELDMAVISSALDRDWTSEHQAITKHRSSPFRWFRGSYRAAIKQIKTVAKDPPNSNTERLKLLGTLIHHKTQVQEIGERQTLGELVAGPLWRGLKTDIAGMLEPVRWIQEQIEVLGSPDALKKQIDQWPETADASALASRLHNCIREAEEKWEKVADVCDLNLQLAFDEESIRNVPLTTIMERMSAWRRDPEGQADWIRLHDMANTVADRGLEEIRRRLADGSLAPKHACGTYDYVRAEAVYHRLTRLNPDLEKISGRNRSGLVEKFRKLDASLLDLSAQEVMSAHYESIPEGTRGEMGVLRGEAQKKTRHMALRRLLTEAGDAVQMLKPVFLMSPQSVARYLDPDGLKFDLLLIDEASQVRPADAIGAMMRSKRAIIVGDQKQLPPTSFFEKLVNSEEEDGEEQETEERMARQIKDMESILALCEGRGMPDYMLKWHYRSQHESLIAVSNKEFYRNELVCPPSPASLSSNLGLTFKFVGGTYRRGKGKSDNPEEAKAVMNAVLEHARQRPGESLGVVAMSTSQQVTIQNEAERMRAIHPELDSFCSKNRENPFFVKNLETVQGDERDVIFISIGYGRTEGGQLFQNFGPVSSEGGERRLNVLFTRAKKRCRVFASIRHTDIRHDQATHRGPLVLRTFLKYAETGEMDVPVIAGKEPDSAFEEAVGDAIRGYGYKVDYQVGSDGFLIDLAVRNPDNESGYVLAIECDGARYHSSRWARERDRMRQHLLEGKGWTFHRIWSTDWFRNPETETREAVEAVRRACIKKDTSPPKTETRRPPVEREEHKEPSPEPKNFYKEFTYRKGRATSDPTYNQIHDTPDRKIADVIAQLVTVEGPVHRDIVVRKIREIWGYDQTGRIIRERINQAIQFSVRRGMVKKCTLDPSFLTVPSTEVHVRDRSELEDSFMKKPERIPPEEYRIAILRAVERCLAISENDCAIEANRMFGFRSTSEGFREQVATQIGSLIREGKLVRQPDGRIRSPGSD